MNLLGILGKRGKTLTKGNMSKTITVKIDQNPGPLFGRPIADNACWLTGRWAIYADGSYWASDEVVVSPNGAEGTVVLHDPPVGWQATGVGQTITTWNDSPYNAPPAPVYKGTETGHVAVPTAPAAESFVKGRTMAQAQALGDEWGFTHDPGTDPK